MKKNKEHLSQNSLLLLAWTTCLILLIFAVGWSWIKLQTEQEVSEFFARQAEASVRPSEIHLACDGLPAKEISECVIERFEEHQRWDDQRRDLHAQEEMAFWAMWMLVFTALAFFAVLGTLYFSRSAAIAADGMLNEARAATASSQENLRITKEGYLKQLRPWMVPTVSNVSITRDTTIEGVMYPEVQIAVLGWENSGQTPATKCKIQVKSTCVPTGEQFEQIFPDEMFGDTLIAPKQVALASVLYVPPVLFQSFQNGELDLIAYSRIDYRHSLEQSHKSHGLAIFRIRRDGFRQDRNGVVEPNYFVDNILSSEG